MLSFRKEKITDHYDITKKLGMGAFGEVSLGVNKSTGNQVAIKKLQMDPKKKEDMATIMNEIMILKECVSVYLFTSRTIPIS